MKNTVLFLIDSLEVLGGAEKNLLQVVSKLESSKFQPIVCCLKSGSAYTAFRNKGIEVINLDLKRVYGPTVFLRAIRLIRLIKKNKVKIIVTYLESSDFWGAIVARIAGVPIVISNRRDIGFNLKRRHVLAYVLINHFFNRIIAVSEAVKTEIIRSQKANADKIITIYNGVELKNDYPKESDIAGLKRSLGLNSHKQTVTMVANLDPIKGHKDFLQAAAYVIKQNNAVQFLLVGSGKDGYKDELRNFACSLGISKDIIFAGFRSDVPAILSISDVSVLSSSTEGFSNVVLESMAAGKPVVAAKTGGNPEAIVEGETGILFPPKNTQALAESIRFLLEDNPTAEKIGQSARLRVESLFSSAIMIEELQNLFETLLVQKSNNLRIRTFESKLKKILKIVLSSILYYSGILYFLGTIKAKTTVRILAYHKITDRDDFLSLATSVTTFKKQMEFLKINYSIISLKEAVSLLKAKQPLPKRAVVITFDDGSKDIFNNAFPVLKELRIPATIFLTVEPIEKHKLLWFDFIAFVIKTSRRKTLNLEFFGLGNYLINTLQEKKSATEQIVAQCKKMNAKLRDSLCEFLKNKLLMDADDLRGKIENEILSWEEIIQMQSSDINFGAHTMSHTILTNMPLQEAELEICESKRTIEQRTGRPCESFAFPNGGGPDFNENIIQILKSNNFLCACALKSAGSNGNFFALNRINLHEALTADLKGKLSKPLFAAAISAIFTSS